ncbi:VRR-NUC domain-containing protein [Circinella umbellata]|nr:VRR-NUC domain-containing protein [Circinella umbellata]
MAAKRLTKRIKLNNDSEQKKLDSYFIVPKSRDQVVKALEIQDQDQQLDQLPPPNTPIPRTRECFIKTTETATMPSSPISFNVGEEDEKPEEEPLFYENSIYTDEFNVMLSAVLDGEKFLFTQSELDIFHTYQYKINGDAKHLFVRLWMRKKRWIRLDKLNVNNKNIRDLESAAQQLHEHGLTAKHEISVDDALTLLSVNELKEIAPCRANNRAEYLSIIKAQFNLEEIHRRIGTCILLDDHVHTLLRRLHLVYYRLTVLEEKSPMTTAILARISRRNYPEYVTCRTTIWESRVELLEYEQALQTELKFEEQSIKAKMDHDDDTLRACWELCANCVGLWEDLLKTRKDKTRPYTLRQFEACQVYTRLIDHGTRVLAKLHEYDLEAVMLRKLLNQKVYRVPKRGRWYDRLALVQSKKKDRPTKKQVLALCIEGIQDPTVHSIDLHKLHRWIHKLQRDLAIPKREQLDFSYLKLRKPVKRIIYGERVSEAVIGRKATWRADDGAECSVEELSLSYYKKQGYQQGHHTEGGMISMLFMLLFWDIVFAPMDGVFETPYQAAPLDMASDAFYAGRVSMINERIGEIEQGKFLELITRVDERERSRETVCIGVNWKYTTEDLLHLAECIGAIALSSLCRLLAEEFGQRRGGMPDLCCWDYESKRSIFVEVKGPGDSLSETQKAWIDTLAGFGLNVEVCHVQVWTGDDMLL